MSAPTADAPGEGRIARLFDRFTPPSLADAPIDVRSQARTAIGFICASILMSAMFSLVNFRQGNLAAAYFEALATVALCVFLPLIRRTGRYLLFGNAAMGFGLSSYALACWYGDGLEAPALLLLPILPAIAYLGYGRRSALFWTSAAAGVTLFLLLAEREGWMPEPLATPAQAQVKRAVEVTLALFFSFLISKIFDDLKAHALSLFRARTDELAAANSHLSELFHNMRQGVVAFDASGKVIGETSAQARVLFGRDELQGTDVRALLYPDPDDMEADAFSQWVELAFAMGSDDWQAVSECAPTTLVRRDDAQGQRHLTLEFRPIFGADGALARIMLLATDETERLRLEREAEAQRKQVDRLQRIAAGGAHLVLQFVRRASSRLTEARAALAQPSVAEDVRARVFQWVHTVKGEAAAFQLDTLEACCGEAEATLQSWPPTGDAGQVRATLDGLLKEALVELEVARDRVVALSPVGEAVLEQVTVRRSELERLCQLAETSGSVSAGALRELAENLAARPFGEAVRQLPDDAQRWARSLGKGVSLDVEGKHVPVPRSLAEVLPGAVTNLVRNALAHGIEYGSERAAGGKPELGTVRVRCEPCQGGVRVEVADDGRGIDEARVRASAGGAASGVADVTDLIFLDGVSTTESGADRRLSGCGVGLGAVRQDLASVGYEITVSSRAGEGTTFRIAPAARASRCAG